MEAQALKPANYWTSTNIFTFALSSLFRVQKHRKKMDRIKRVPALPLVGVSGGTVIESTHCNGVVTASSTTPSVMPPRNQPPIQVVPTTQQTSPQAPQPEPPTTQQPKQPTLAAQQPAKRTSKDFIFGRVIGEGSFSTVYLTKDIHTSKEYAIKVCDKRHIIREKKTEYVKRERDVLNIISSAGAPFFVKFYCTFQDTDNLYFVLSYATNGELYPYINKVGAFDIECTRFYAGEIVVALEHLRRLNIIHRDLKPENILLDEKMHILITDFGSAKILPSNTSQANGDATTDNRPPQRRNSFVGTAQYVSPELLHDRNANFATDLWAFGCIVYQMISGLPPFRERSEYAIFQKILKLDYEIPDGFDKDAEDLVRKLLVLEANSRLGAQDENGYPSIRNHSMFRGLDFDNLQNTTPPKISPYLPQPSHNIPDHLEPGLDSQLSRLMGLDELSTTPCSPRPSETPTTSSPRGVTSALRNEATRSARLASQEASSNWHSLVDGRLILKQGVVYKRKGLFARRRMLLLTEGPRLFYADPATMSLKGEIPWSKTLSTEPKNFKIFFVHTPNRTYYLEEPDGYALEWCKAIDEVKNYYTVDKSKP